jgi:hypothetical protein
MTDEYKIIFALMQIDNISKLIEGLPYEQFFVSHLMPLKVELERQLTNHKHSSKLKG